MRGIVIERATWSLCPLEIKIRCLTNPVNTYRTLRTMDYGACVEEAEYDALTGEPGKWSETTIERFVRTLPRQMDCGSIPRGVGGI